MASPERYDRVVPEPDLINSPFALMAASCQFDALPDRRLKMTPNKPLRELARQHHFSHRSLQLPLWRKGPPGHQQAVSSGWAAN